MPPEEDAFNFFSLGLTKRGIRATCGELLLRSPRVLVTSDVYLYICQLFVDFCENRDSILNMRCMSSVDYSVPKIYKYLIFGSFEHF